MGNAIESGLLTGDGVIHPPLSAEDIATIQRMFANSYTGPGHGRYEILSNKLEYIECVEPIEIVELVGEKRS